MPAAAIMEKIVDLHHDTLFFLIVVVTFVPDTLARIVHSYNLSSKTTTRKGPAQHTARKNLNLHSDSDPDPGRSPFLLSALFP
jgi:heme/copper-type cytochrome/quinol oxidase subunit 2